MFFSKNVALIDVSPGPAIFDFFKYSLDTSVPSIILLQCCLIFASDVYMSDNSIDLLPICVSNLANLFICISMFVDRACEKREREWRWIRLRDLSNIAIFH